MTQKTPAQQRAEAEAALQPLGQERIRLVAELERLDGRLRPLVRSARAVEVPLRRIGELTGLAPNTVRSWTR
jgi:hypothetical protein